MRKTVLTFCLITATLFAFAQSKDSLNALNGKYRHEIGVDMPFFNKNGVALIFKKQKSADLNSSKNLRIQASLNGHVPVMETSKIDTATMIYKVKDNRDFNAQVLIGTEKVKHFGRFNFYYGCDFGLSYSNFRGGYTVMVDTMLYNQGFYNQMITVSQRTGLVIEPFVGAKYRFSEHFSASIETGFLVRCFMTTTKTEAVNPNAKIKMPTTQTTTGVDFYPQYLRFLTLNYHF